MKETTKKRKKAMRGIDGALGRQQIIGLVYQIFARGKHGFDAIMKELGRMIIETIMYIEREEIAGPVYQPFSCDIRKWASQGGSVYIGDQKIKVEHPRLRGQQGENHRGRIIGTLPILGRIMGTLPILCLLKSSSLPGLANLKLIFPISPKEPMISFSGGLNPTSSEVSNLIG